MGTSQWIRREEHALWGLDDHVDPELDLFGSLSAISDYEYLHCYPE